MRAAKCFDKSDYINPANAPCIKEFATIANAAEYLAEKYNEPVERMTAAIMNDTNADAFYFADGSVVIYEF